MNGTTIEANMEDTSIEVEDAMCHPICQDLCNPSISTPDSLLSALDNLSSHSESSGVVDHFTSLAISGIAENDFNTDDDIDSAVNVEEGSVCDSVIGSQDLCYGFTTDFNNICQGNDTASFEESMADDGSCSLKNECGSTSGIQSRKSSSESVKCCVGTYACYERLFKSTHFGTKSTTGLILETRPHGLPVKNEEEERRHRKMVEDLIQNTKRKERKAEEQNRSLRERQLKHEEAISNALQVWNKEILPSWESVKNTKRVKSFWWSGLPPSIRGRVWKLAIANDLNITPELYDICLVRAKERIRIIKESAGSDSDSIGSFSVAICESAASRESSVDVIRLDVSRTFPQLGIFQKGGPYHDLLQGLLGAYACYRPDVGYVQGMSFIAAVLLLNMEINDAFVCFANILNQPCQLAFFRLDESLMKAYFETYEELLKENLPRLSGHLSKNGLTSSLYIIDWIFTLYAKSLSLDVASRVWDVFFRDGEEFLFRTALGILKLYQDVLLQFDFIQLAEFLTKLPSDLNGDDLFRAIESTSMTSKKRSFAEILASYRDCR